jgi:hypothetical protein
MPVLYYTMAVPTAESQGFPLCSQSTRRASVQARTPGPAATSSF